MRRAPLLIALTLVATACSSKEEQVCRKTEQLMASEFKAFGPPSPAMTPEKLDACIADEKKMQERLGLDPTQYQAMLDCKLAAASVSEIMTCYEPGIEKAAAAAKAPIDAMIASFEADTDAAIARLESKVASGAVSAATVASVRERRSRTPTGRIVAVIDDALGLMSAGRVSAASPVAINLQPGLGSAVDGPPAAGLDAAELHFTDAGATVARLAPLSIDHLGAKSDQIAALFDWMIAEPATRRVEILVDSKPLGGITFEPPPALRSAIPRFEAAGLADRPVIWLDAKPLTLAQWNAR